MVSCELCEIFKSTFSYRAPLSDYRWKLFKNNKKCLLFQLKSFFRSQDIEIFGLILFLVMQKNAFIRKIRLISKSTTSQPGKQIIAIHIFASISRSKGYQTMKFVHLIEYYRRNIFLKNHIAKLFPGSFLKNQDWAYLGINNLKFYVVCFYCIPSWGLSKYFETKLQTSCFYLI